MYNLNEVYGLTRDVPLNYMERSDVDQKLKENLNREKHIIIFGSSKQGKTCLRKHCLDSNKYIIVQCNNRWNITDLNANILKRAGYEVTESTKMSVGGKAKIIASINGKAKIIEGSLEGEGEKTDETATIYRPLELDAEDANDIIAALKEINFDKYIVLEDFHYLKQETQRNFAFELKAFHENSKLCFVIIGVWLDENKLAIYNGDLTGRIIPINADDWNNENLRLVIEKGAELLNIKFTESFIEGTIKSSSGNVYIVQETCYRACRIKHIYTTQTQKMLIGDDLNPAEIICQIIKEQSGRYNTFIQNYANGFQDTTLEMHKWLLYPILTSDISQLSDGLSYRYIRQTLERVHPKKHELNRGNVTQALKSVASLQLTKSIQPFILDYDESNLILHIVDRGFLIWLSMQDRNDLLASVDLPEMSESTPIE